MAFADRCNNAFSSTIRARGLDYFNQDHVRLVGQSENAFEFKVLGSDRAYRVQIDFRNSAKSRALDVDCECPYFQGGDLCKHLWACTLAVDAFDLAQKIPGNGNLGLSSPFLGRALDEEDFDDDGDEQHDEPLASVSRRHSGLSPRQFRKYPPSWQEKLSEIENAQKRLKPAPGARAGGEPGKKVAFYVIHLPLCQESGRLVLDVWEREHLKTGRLGRPRFAKPHTRFRHEFFDPADEELVTLFRRVANQSLEETWQFGYSHNELRVFLDELLEKSLLPALQGTGRLLLGVAGGDWDENAPAMRLDQDDQRAVQFRLQLTAEVDGYRLRGSLLERDGSLVSSIPLHALNSGNILFPGLIRKLDRPSLVPWLNWMIEAGREHVIPYEEAARFVEQILSSEHTPEILLPVELKWKERKLTPVPRLVFATPEGSHAAGLTRVGLEMNYQGVMVPPCAGPRKLPRPTEQELWERDWNCEKKALTDFTGLLPASRTEWIAAKEVPDLAWIALQRDWEVVAEKCRIVRPDSIEIAVKSGIDWFELDGNARFEGSQVALPELLQGLRGASRFVELGNGKLGLLPERWLEKYELLANSGKAQGNVIRIPKSQALLLHSALSDDEKTGHLKLDADFLAFRKKIRSFQGIEDRTTPRGFQGRLRPYQQEGLAWLCFLHEYRLGGILADDMGLGKTVQILAFFEELRSRRRNSPRKEPRFLVIAPKSLAHNWAEEAGRFAPALRIVVHTGGDRHSRRDDLLSAHLVITTYSTLRLDLERLCEIQFDVAVLDEAQAIKNESSQVARACKRIRAELRLAVTGTPVENRLDDLLSILEFTHPGLFDFGKNTQFSARARKSIATVLRPVLLRRQKAEVLQDLPEKSEQTLHLELSPEERRLYDQLKEHYRTALLEKIEEEGVARARFQVLEALLRLRQAACHPGLLGRKEERPSSKVEFLIGKLNELAQEGHKALVFSQFTSLLDLVEARLQAQGIRYTRLDGSTQDRQARVREFQGDPSCTVFLISLKAGGTGLNLTEASYVFLLDPWWNPAVEAQAIDRAHRIGQRQKVTAYRLIARGTVEEKIALMQESKRELAEAIFSEDPGFLNKLSRGDLEALFD